MGKFSYCLSFRALPEMHLFTPLGRPLAIGGHSQLHNARYFSDQATFQWPIVQKALTRDLPSPSVILISTPYSKKE